MGPWAPPPRPPMPGGPHAPSLTLVCTHVNHSLPQIRRLLLLMVLATVGGFAAPAHGQALTPGTRVRVAIADARTVGRVEHSSSDSLVLSPSRGGAVAVPWNRIDRVEHSLGRRGRPGRGALIGAGAMTALTVGAIVFGGSDNEVQDDLEDTIMIIALPVNAAVGAGIGALVGLAWRTERWAVVPVGPGAHGPGARVSARM